MPKRERSRTPEVHWESLPLPKTEVRTQRTRERAKDREKPAVDDRPAGKPQATQEEKLDPKAAGALEREAWQRLVVRLAALRGDREVEAFLAQQHPELQRIAERCGAGRTAVVSLARARDESRSWFERGLKGSNRHGPAARAALAESALRRLKERAEAILAKCIDEPQYPAEALEAGRSEEEGPLICSLLSKELDGSSYEGLWISHDAPGVYLLHSLEDGEDKMLLGGIRVQMKVVDGKLQVDGYFDDDNGGVLRKAKAPLGVFLTVYFEGGTLREATVVWEARAESSARRAQESSSAVGSGRRGAADEKEAEKRRRMLKMQEGLPPLPPGWEIRESRSKKGVYYYANEAKGLSQLERPQA